jgi:hypothetical protein
MKRNGEAAGVTIVEQLKENTTRRIVSLGIVGSADEPISSYLE